MEEINLHLLNKKGKEFASQGKTEEAINIFKAVITIDPLYFLSNFNLGILYSQNGNKKQAILCYLNCLKEKSNDKNTHINLIYCFLEINKEKEAYEIINTYCTNNTDDTEMQNLKHLVENKLSKIKDKINTAYLIFGEDITSSGIIKNQVIPLLIALSKNEKYEITLVSMVREGFIYSKEALEYMIRSLKIYNIKVVIIHLTSSENAINKLKELVIQENIRLIHCRSYFASQYALEIKKRLNIPFIFDVRGLMPEEQKIFKDDNRGYDVSYEQDETYLKHKLIERQLVENANSTVVLNQLFNDNFRKQYNVIQRINIVNNFVDLGKFIFNKTNRNEIRTRLKFKNKVVFVFSGSMSPWYDFDLLIKWFSEILTQKLDAVLLLLTYFDKSSNIGYNEDYFYNLLDKYKVSRDNFLIIQPNTDDVPNYLSASDVAVIPHKKRYSKILSVAQPVKYAEYLANGLPVLSNNLNEEMVGINKKYPQSGLVVTDEMTQYDHDFLNNILSFNKENIEEARNSIMKIAQKHYNLEDVLSKYDKIYSDIRSL